MIARDLSSGPALSKRQAHISAPALVIECLVALVACIGILAFFHTYGQHTAGGADAYGYVSEALGLAQGHFRWPEQVFSPFGVAEDAWLTHPLGYVERGLDTIVPTYPFGYPLVMAGFMRIAGFDAAFWVTPLLAAGAVLLTYLLARAWLGRLGGLIAALLVLILPNFIFVSLVPFSDAPATFFAALALFALLRPHPRPWTDVLLGFAVGFGIWVRPNLAFILLPPLAWLLYRREFGRLARFGLTLLPFVVVEALVNQHLYGAPWLTGYGPLPWAPSVVDAAQRGLRHLQRLNDQQAGIGLFLVAMGLVAGRLPLRLRVLLAGFAALFLLFFAFYAIDDAWWYGRFLLPGLPALALLEASAVVRLAEPGQDLWLRRAALVIGLALFTWVSLDYAQTHEVWTMTRGDTVYQITAHYVREQVRDPAVVLAMQHSGTLRLYGGLATARYDRPIPQLTAKLRQVMQAGGTVYLLADDYELGQIRQSDEAVLLDGADEVGRVGPDMPTLFRLHLPH